MSASIVRLMFAFVGSLVVLYGVSAASPVSQVGSSKQPGEIRQVVPPEEREVLGLMETAWTRIHGKIHPDVYAILETDDRPWPRPVGYEGTVYAEVHLRHEPKGKIDSLENQAAIHELQGRILSQLTAAEFYVEYPFRTHPGILGYVNRAGLEKLKAIPDVTAVCLDDKPFPQRPERVFKEDLPPLEPDDPSIQRAGGRFFGSGGKAEIEVWQALGLHERVFVMVQLTFTRADEPLGTELSAHISDVETRVQSVLTAHEFWVQGRTTSFPRLHGLVNVEGLRKLENHPDVQRIGMQDVRYHLPHINQKRP